MILTKHNMKKEKEGEEEFFVSGFFFFLFFGWVSCEVCFRVVGYACRSPSSSHGVRSKRCFFKLLILGQSIRRGEGGGESHATNMSFMDYAFDDDVGNFEPQPMVASP
jgi:hypothetical protein